jgi:hypothetical protein
MWEAHAADERLADLVAHVVEHADPAAQVYRSAGDEERVVVIDPSGRGVPDVPDALLARPAHQWMFDPVERPAK